MEVTVAKQPKVAAPFQLLKMSYI